VAGPDWSETYSYDPSGNIAAAAWPVPPGPAAARAGAFAQGPRESAGTLITRAGGVRYQHDQAGRIILRQRTRDSRKPETWRYQWDAEDRLVCVITPDGTTWRYLYDPLGRRMAKLRLATDGSLAGTTEFTWDGPVLAEQATQGHLVTWSPGITSPGPAFR
jgi:YD repeat-containing protein